MNEWCICWRTARRCLVSLLLCYHVTYNGRRCDTRVQTHPGYVQNMSGGPRGLNSIAAASLTVRLPSSSVFICLWTATFTGTNHSAVIALKENYAAAPTEVWGPVMRENTLFALSGYEPTVDNILTTSCPNRFDVHPRCSTKSIYKPAIQSLSQVTKY